MKIAISFCLTRNLITSINASKFSVRFLKKSREGVYYLTFTDKTTQCGGGREFSTNLLVKML